MNKIAQRRGLLNKIRESVNAPGEAISGAFSPEFTRLMDILREVDDEAREHAIDLKDILKVARSNYNRREYMTTIAYLGKFHERLELVRWQFVKLNKDADAIHNEFLFGDLDSEHKTYLFDKMPERYKPKPKTAPVAKADDGLGKEAGVKDWWHNLTSDRGKSLKNWEKRFPKAAKEIKRQTEKMLNRSEMFLNFLMSTFKTLATLRATRKLEEYIKVSGGFVTKYMAYDDAFNEYFNGSVKKYIDSQKEYEKKKEERESINKERAEYPGEGLSEKENLESLPSIPSIIPPSNGNPSGGGESASPSNKTIEKEVEEMFQEEMNNKPGAFPKVPTEPLTEPEVMSDELIPSSDPSTPHPSGQRRPLQYTPLFKNPEMQSELAQSVEAPVTPTMRSPVMTDSFLNPSIPKAPKVPNLSELERPLTPEQTDRFMYYTPKSVAPPSNQNPTVPHKPVAEKPKPKLELMPATIPETQAYPATTASQFIEKLTKLAGQNPLVLAAEIIKFAKTLESSDKTTSDRLVVVAKNLLK